MAWQFVHDLFRDRCRTFPDQSAIETHSGSITYHTLLQRLDALAASLAQRLSPGEIVAVFSHRTEWIVVAELAVLECGCVFVPLDPEQPAERNRLLLRKVAPDHLLGDEALKASAMQVSELVAADRWISIDTAERSAPFHRTWTPGPDDLSHIYFTSGSTGTPKAIAGRLSAIDHFARWEIEAVGAGPGTRVAQLANPLSMPSSKMFLYRSVPAGRSAFPKAAISSIPQRAWPGGCANGGSPSYTVSRPCSACSTERVGASRCPISRWWSWPVSRCYRLMCVP